MSGHDTSGVSTLEGHWLAQEHPGWKSGLGKLDLSGSFCVHLLHTIKCSFRDGFRVLLTRLPLSQDTQEGKRKNQKTRQALLGVNTNEDKFPLSVSKDFSSSYLISFLWNVSRDFNIFLLRVWVSLTTLSFSLSPWISPNTQCAVIGVLS